LTVADIQYFANHSPIANQKLAATEMLVCAGGPATNAAVAFSALNGEADLLTCLGNNPFSELISNDLTKQNISIIDTMQGQPFNIGVSSVITNIGNGDRTIITKHPDQLNQAILTNNAIDISHYEIVLTDGFYPEISAPIIKQAKEAGIPVVFDGGSWKPHLTEVLPFVDIAICSEHFCPPGIKEISQIFRFLHRLGASKAAITRGEKSILWSESNVQGEVMVCPVEAIDTLGAGDIFHGAFTYFYCNGDPFCSSLEKASSVAAFSLKHKGTRQWIDPFKKNVPFKNGFS